MFRSFPAMFASGIGAVLASQEVLSHRTRPRRGEEDELLEFSGFAMAIHGHFTTKKGGETHAPPFYGWFSEW